MLTSIYTTRLKEVISALELTTTFNVALHLNVTMIRNLFNNVSSTAQIISSYNTRRITVNGFGRVSKGAWPITTIIFVWK
jgi:wyosine [tRNA(Phe)-imidazoG37] synthetase (radical SAM superfamily)